MTVRDEKSTGYTFLSIRLDERLKEELERVARLNDRTLSGQARQMLRDSLREHALADEAAA